jgi:hypothetical protein
MNRPDFSRGLIVAGVALGLATAFTALQSCRFVAAKRELAAARANAIRNLVALSAREAPAPAAVKPVPTAPTPTAAAPDIAPDFVERLEELKRNAGTRGPGGVPLIFPEDLFPYHAPLRRAYLAAMQGQQRVDYGAFFANTRLTPAEIEQFLAIRMERELAWLDLVKVYHRLESGPPRPVVAESNRQADEAQQAKLSALLGPSRFEQFTRYEAELFSRNGPLGLKNLVAATYSTDEPVTAAQVNQLSALVTASGLFVPSKANEHPEAFAEVAAQAAGILSPRQLDLFELLLDYHQASLGKWRARQAAAPDPTSRKP